MIDRAMHIWAIFLLVLGLIFAASGFGIFVVGRLDGFVMIVVGVAMFWGGWTMSRARGRSCAIASFLNVIDAALTFAFWNFEINPVVLTAGPTVFLVAKIASSLAIMLYAKLSVSPERGGIVLAMFFSFVIGWNLSQRFLADIDFYYGTIIGALLSFAASAAILLALFKKQMKRAQGGAYNEERTEYVAFRMLRMSEVARM
ncbi:MAG: hypothetical protein ACETV1_07760 [Candidatus Bathyarchaeia archaeon]